MGGWWGGLPATSAAGKESLRGWFKGHGGMLGMNLGPMKFWGSREKERRNDHVRNEEYY